MNSGEPDVTNNEHSGRWFDVALVTVGVMMVAYHLASARFAYLGSFENQTVHLAFLFTMTFLGACRQMRSPGGRMLQFALLLAGLGATTYVFVNLEHLEDVVGFPDHMDVAVGVLLIVLAVEGTRRTWGWMLPIVVLTSIAYFLFGDWIPGALHHRHFVFSYIVSYLSIGLTGVYGTFLSISANQIFLFVVFGSLMGLLNINGFLYELGKLVGRRLSGGPGQTAVVASSLMGMVTGAAVANVAITGAFTIPYMKRVGYPSALAGAIEATASTGSQLMPPVMGAAAFLLASFIGVPYADVMVAAIIPAILFYLTIMLGVQFASVAMGIHTPREDADKRVILRGLPMFLIPVGVITALLLMRFSTAHAAFWAIITVIALSFLRSGKRPTLTEIVHGMADGAVVGAQIGISLCAVGIIAQTLITTGLGSKIAGLVELLSGGSVAIALILTMLVSLILGCGVPAVAAYSLVAIVAAPTLIRMGLPALSTHFFCFYFAIISAVTPPVGLAALAAAGIAKAPYFETGLRAFKLSIAGFIIPFLVVFNPVLNFNPNGFFTAAGSIVTIPLGLLALTSSLYGVALDRLSPAHRAVMFAAAAALLGYALLRGTLDVPLQLALIGTGITCLVWVFVRQLGARGSRQAPLSQQAVQLPPH